MRIEQQPRPPMGRQNPPQKASGHSGGQPPMGTKPPQNQDSYTPSPRPPEKDSYYPSHSGSVTLPTYPEMNIQPDPDLPQQEVSHQPSHLPLYPDGNVDGNLSVMPSFPDQEVGDDNVATMPSFPDEDQPHYGYDKPDHGHQGKPDHGHHGKPPLGMGPQPPILGSITPVPPLTMTQVPADSLLNLVIPAAPPMALIVNRTETPTLEEVTSHGKVTDGLSHVAEKTYLVLESDKTTENDTIAHTFSKPEDYYQHLLEKYEGMTTYNITLSDEALTKAMADPEMAKVLEEMLQQDIANKDNHQGDMKLVHTELHISDITGSNGSYAFHREGYHVMATDEKHAESYEHKAEVDDFSNKLEQLLIENDKEDSFLTGKEIGIVEDILATFDTVYYEKNPTTGQSNYLNSIYMKAGLIKEENMDYNENVLKEVSAIREKLAGMVEKNDTSYDPVSEDVLAIMQEAIAKMDEILEGNSPLYDVDTNSVGQILDIGYPHHNDHFIDFDEFQNYVGSSNGNVERFELSDEKYADILDKFKNTLEK